MVILKYALKRILRNPVTLVANFILPIVLIILPVLWNGDGRGYFLLAMVIMFGAFPLTGGMLADRRERVVVRIMSTPTTAFRYLSQNLIACMTPLFVQVTLISSLGIILHGWTLSFAFFIGVLYFFFAASSVAFSFAWNCLFKNKEVSFSILSMVLTLASFAGLLIPLSILPDYLRNIAMIFPAYWIANGLEYLISYGVNIQYGISLLVLLIFTFMFILFGSKRGIH